MLGGVWRMRAWAPLWALLLTSGAWGQYRNEGARVGVNLATVADWSSSLPFVDVFKNSRPWVSQRPQGGPWNTREEIALTPEGWVASLQPNQAAAALMCRDLEGHYPAGRYVCLYDGEGRIEFRLEGRAVSQRPGRIELEVKPGNSGILLRILQTNPENPVRNIRVLMPGFEETYRDNPFRPGYLELLSPFRVIRFMNWQKTNGSPLVSWSERPTPEWATQAGPGGVAIEHMVDLCNRLKADAWFCVPHAADDNFVRRFAERVRDTLDPELRVYVEYSNEVWNTLFGQSKYALEQGQKLGLSRNPNEARLRYYAERATQVFGIWREVFGESERLVRVLGSQNASPWATQTVLGWKDTPKHADALAVAPYFGGRPGSEQNAPVTLVQSMDEVLDGVERSVFDGLERIREQHKLAAQYGLPLIAYEGGPGMVAERRMGNNAELTGKLSDAHRHPRMRAIYRTYLEQWEKAGGGLMMVFVEMDRYSRFGSWGLAEWYDQNLETVAKYQGVLDYLRGGN